jgi:hypothetical protein
VAESLTFSCTNDNWISLVHSKPINLKTCTELIEELPKFVRLLLFYARKRYVDSGDSVTLCYVSVIRAGLGASMTYILPKSEKGTNRPILSLCSGTIQSCTFRALQVSRQHHTMRRPTASSPSTEQTEWGTLGRCGICGKEGEIGRTCSGCCFFQFTKSTFQPIPMNSETPMNASPTEKVRLWWRRVGRTNGGGRALPDNGQLCLIIKGDDQKHFGRMGVVLRHSKERAVLGYRLADGKEEEAKKSGGSLLLLQDGLEAKNDALGRLWIVRVNGTLSRDFAYEASDDDNDDNGDDEDNENGNYEGNDNGDGNYDYDECLSGPCVECGRVGELGTYCIACENNSIHAHSNLTGVVKKLIN